MKKLSLILLAILIFLLFTVFIPSISFDINIVGALFIIGNVLMLLATYSILRYGKASSKKFDDGDWYEDSDRT